MKKARSVPRTIPPIVPATGDPSQREEEPEPCPVVGSKDINPNRESQPSAPRDRLMHASPDIALLPDNGTASSCRVTRVGTASARNGDVHSEQAVAEGDEFDKVDRALEEALGGGVTGKQGVGGGR